MTPGIKHAPGPKGNFFAGSLLPFSTDSLGFLKSQIETYGDVVKLRFAHIPAIFINDPHIVQEVLMRRASEFDKNTRSVAKIRSSCGDSLLSANEEAWARHRKLVQPVFMKSYLETASEGIKRSTAERLENWASKSEFNIVTEMMHLLIDVSANILFGSSVDVETIETGLDVLLADTWRRIQAPIDVSDISPKLHRKPFKEAVAKLDEIIFSIIAARRANPDPHNDVLSRLLKAHESEGDGQLSDKELRDAAVTLLLAGHETTANALSWTLIRTAQSGLETKNPALLFAEAVRLYPSIWIIERRAKSDMNLAGYQIKKGTSVMMAPYFLHRRTHDWGEPESFNPDRFLTKQPTDRPTCSYMPFGFGRNSCVGRNMAERVAVDVLSTIYEKARLELLPGQSLIPDPSLTLRVKNPVMMRAVFVA